MPRRSGRSARRSTTSPRTSSRGKQKDPQQLAGLIDGLPKRRFERVFTHSSWAPDRTLSYERLEFLGDSVLELAVARALYDAHPGLLGGAAGEDPLARRLAAELRGRRARAGARQAAGDAWCQGAARGRAAAARPEPERARGAARGRARRALPRAGLRADRTRDRRRVRRAHPLRADDVRRSQDGAAGSARARRAQRP